jgi:hypothetical protein
LPKAIRDHLKLSPGYALSFRVVAVGSVRVEPAQAASASTSRQVAAARLRRRCGRPRLGARERAAPPVILVDTCALRDVSGGSARWRDWSIDHLAHWRLRGPLLINPIVFAEW